MYNEKCSFVQMFEAVVYLVHKKLAVIAAAGWQHWIMFKFEETVKTNKSSCYLSV